MKQRKSFIYIPSLLFAVLLSTNVYGNEIIEINGDGNVTGDKNITGDGNIVCQGDATCQINNYPEAAPNINQPNSVPEKTEKTYYSSPDGYTPVQNPAPRITNSRGYTPIQNPPPQMSTP